MARTKTATINDGIEITDADTPGLPVMVEAANQFVALEANYNHERDLINRLIGRQELANASEAFFRTVRISDLANIKENKLYRALNGMQNSECSEKLKGTWEDFCGLIGQSVDKVDLDISNLRAFGEEALESMQRIGIGYRQLREYRQLPDDQRQALIVAAKLNDKDTFLEIAEDLINKHVTETAAVKKENADLKADAEATERVLADKNTQADKLERELHKLRNKAGDWHPRVFEIANETNLALGHSMEQLDKLDTLRDVILNEDFEDQDKEAAVEMMAVVYYDACNQIMGRLAEVMHACDSVFVGYKEKARPILQVFAERAD